MRIKFDFEFNLFSRKKEFYPEFDPKIHVIEFPKGMKSEILFPRKIWMDLKNNDYLIYRKSKKLVKIKKAKDGFVELETGAFYVPCDRLFFIPVI